MASAYRYVVAFCIQPDNNISFSFLEQGYESRIHTHGLRNFYLFQVKDILLVFNYFFTRIFSNIDQVEHFGKPIQSERHTARCHRKNLYCIATS